MKLNSKRESEQGQATIEFLMTFIFTFGIFVLFISLALNMTAGYFVHYATFMSGRAFMAHSGGGNDANATDNAAVTWSREVFRRYGINLLNLDPSKLSFTLPSSGASQELIGVRYEFDRPISMMKVIGKDMNAHYMSEAYLGREPSRIDCLMNIHQIFEIISRGEMNISPPPGGINTFVTYFDDGC